MFDGIKFFVVFMTSFYALLQECSTTDIVKEPYELSDLFGEFKAKTWNGTWITGDAFYYEIRSGHVISVVLYNVANRRKSILIEYADPRTPDIEKMIPSPDLQYILIKYNKSNDIMETVATAQYKILKLDNSEADYYVGDNNALQHAQWGLRGHSLFYVFDFDIYYLESPEDAPKPRRLTYDGAAGQISNGISQDNGYPKKERNSVKFSPNGKHLAFLKFNYTEVENYDYSVYGEPGDLNDQYPRIKKNKYSKVGSNIPVVSVCVIDLTKSASPEQIYNIPSVLVFELAWPTEDTISFLCVNRVQNSAQVVRCDTHGSPCTEESSYYEPDNGWIEPHMSRYRKNTYRRVAIQPAAEGNDTYYHLVLTDTQNKDFFRLTYGRRRVTEISHWDESNNLIYYQSTIEDYPSREHAFRINTITLEDVCITCSFRTPSGPCLRGTVDINEDATHFAKICKGPGPDYVVLSDVMEASTPIIWEDNSELLLKLSKKLQPMQKDLLVPIAGGYNARVRLFFPPEYEETSSRVYPTLVYAYPGPDADVISDAYDSHFLIKNYWVTNLKYIYVMIEGRGSRGDGRNKMFEVYRKLGTVEIEDQINVTRYLQQNVPGIDPNNTGIWGWGYAGFSAGMVIARDNEIVERNDSIPVFALAALVSPITNLLYSSSINIEKYMGLPTEEDNLAGYKKANLCSRADQLNTPLLLIHGTADSKINYQHTIMLIEALHRANQAFNLMVYPDADHDLSNNKVHAFVTIDKFLFKNYYML